MGHVRVFQESFILSSVQTNEEIYETPAVPADAEANCVQSNEEIYETPYVPADAEVYCSRWEDLSWRKRVLEKSIFAQIWPQIRDTKPAPNRARSFAPRPILGSWSWGVAYLRQNLS